jgi:hypothetical protein
LAANAAMHLGEWEKLEKYNKMVGVEGSDHFFWKAAIAIHSNDLEDAAV